MKERLRDLLSEVGASFASLRSAVRNLSRSMAELEEVVERSRTFATNATLSTPTDRAAIAQLLKSTQKILGPPPGESPERHGMAQKDGTAHAHIAAVEC